MQCEIKDLNVVGRLKMKKKNCGYLFLKNKEHRTKGYIQEVKGFAVPSDRSCTHVLIDILYLV